MQNIHYIKNIMTPQNKNFWEKNDNTVWLYLL